MQYLSGRSPNTSVVRETRGNVIWLSYPERDRTRRSTNPVASLQQSVAILADEIERSRKLGTAITAAVETGRYELSKVSAPHAERYLARVQRAHLGSLLRFVRGVAAAGSRDGARPDSEPAAEADPLTRSIHELQASLQQARRLSQDVLALSRRQ